ncbi:MORN repeat-containing protein [Tenacibaculum jejuense]|uniref:Putative phosphatidylinositol 4-phosphate 5-kinase n=1 Tax=Tenacibaculum jejuense TaxID=584609 RepID=A0A238U593_9FLAO|nr:hypothetical protein [Tenacibaculum jejuense]SNR14381.1 putative phosphatidylinositol 4-phosphate 5-kinase [Tenacibaculum jejuense]
MKVSKTSIIFFLVLFVTLIAIAINGNVKQNHLQEKITSLENEHLLLKEKVVQEKNLTHIDSLLIDGKYETALTAYEKQFSDSIVNQDKDYVKFRIKIAKQFVNLKQIEKKSKITQNITNANASHQNANTRLKDEKYDSLYTILKKTRRQLYASRRKLKKKTSFGYLTFKSSKKHIIHYVGEINNKKANGYGIAIFDTGGRYEGNWKNNNREGKGIFHWADGEYYEGDYKNDLRNGSGTYFWTNGKKYTGGWKDDERQGKGIYYNKKGKTLAKGIWKKDKLVEETE